MNGIAADQGSGFRTEAVVAHCHWYESRSAAIFYLFRRKIALRPYQYRYVRTGSVGFGKQLPWRAVVAPAHKALSLHTATFQESRQGGKRLYTWQYGFERLLHGGNGYFFDSLYLEVLTLRPLATNRNKTVYSYLYKFLHQPLHTVGMLCRRHSNGNRRLPHFRKIYPLHYLYRGSFRVVADKTASIQPPTTVDDFQLVADTPPEHSDGMAALHFRKNGLRAYIRCVETYRTHL